MLQNLVRFTVGFQDSTLDADALNQEVSRLLVPLKEMDEIEAVYRVRDPAPPTESKTIGGFLTGLLMAEVNADNCKKVLGFLSNRLGNKPISLEVEANGKKLKVTAYSQEELQAAIQAAQDFVAA